MLTFFLHTEISQTVQRNFCRKKCFLLVNFFTPSYSIKSGSRNLWGKNLTHLTSNILFIFEFKTCSYRSRKKILRWKMYFGWTETSKHSYAYELLLVLLIQHNSDMQIQAWFEPCSMCFTPGLQLQRQLNYTKFLVPDVVSNTENRALKKQTMNSNPRYSPGNT